MTKKPVDKGQLIYLVGASGAGKDTLLNTLRSDTTKVGNTVVMRRHITRSVGMGNENHIELSHDEFIHKRDKGSFSLDWQAHDTFYGIDTALDTWLDKGVNVLVNGSRAYFPQALMKYPNIHLVWLKVDPEILQQRLVQRGRENLLDIQQRIERNKKLDDIDSTNCFILENNGEIDSTIKQLYTIIDVIRLAGEVEKSVQI